MIFCPSLICYAQGAEFLEGGQNIIWRPSAVPPKIEASPDEKNPGHASAWNRAVQSRKLNSQMHFTKMSFTKGIEKISYFSE